MSVVSNVEVRIDAKNAIKQFKLLQAEAKEFNRELNGTQQEVQATGASFTGLLGKITTLVGGVATLKKGLDAAFAREAAENRLKNLTSSTAEYELALKVASVAAKDFGLTQTTATAAIADTYSRLNNLGYGLKQINELYRGFNVVAKEAGVSSDDAAGAFLQLSQALGAGVLNGDELAIILDRMPQLAQKIAAEMGVSAGQIKKLGSEGKITGDIIYKALQRSAESSTDLSGKLTEQQATMSLVAQRAEEMFVELGKALAPAFLTAIDALGRAAFLLGAGFQRLNEFINRNAEGIERVVKAGIEVAKIVVAVKIVIKIYALWQKAVVAVAAAKAGLLALTGKGLALVALGASAAAGVYIALGGAVDGVTGAVDDLAAESEAFYDQNKRDIATQIDQYSGVPPVIEQQATALKRVNKELEKNLRLASQVYKTKALGIDREIQLLSVTSDIEKTRLNSALEKARAGKDFNKVYEIQIKLAEIDFDLATKQIQAEVKKLKLAYELLRAKKAIVEASIIENEANGAVVASLQEKLALLDVEVKEAKASLEFGEKLAKEQMKQAKAVKAAAEEAAKMQLEQSLASEAAAKQAASTDRTASNAERAANAMARQTQELQKQAKRTETFQMSKELMDLARGDRTFANVGEQIEFFREAEKPFIELKQKSESLSQAQDLQAKATEAASLGMNSLARQLERYAEQVASAGKVLSQFRESKSEQSSDFGAALTPYATGGYVKKPTKALIGEAGPEYVIREDQMKEAMTRYASGKRGDAVIPGGSASPNISIKTGPIMQVDGQDYVSRADFERGMKEMSSSLLTTIRRSPSTRSRLGI